MKTRDELILLYELILLELIAFYSLMWGLGFL